MPFKMHKIRRKKKKKKKKMKKKRVPTLPKFFKPVTRNTLTFYLALVKSV